MPATGRVAIPSESHLVPGSDSIERERRLCALAERQYGVSPRSVTCCGAQCPRRAPTRCPWATAPRASRRLCTGSPRSACRGSMDGRRVGVRGGSAAVALVRGRTSPVAASWWIIGIDVTIAGRRGLSRPGLRVHRPERLGDADRAVVRGIPCTSVPRTLLDLAQVVSHRVLERACDQAEVLGVLDMNAVRELLARRERHPGVGRLRAALDTGRAREGISRSALEERFLRLCRRSELPQPEVNVWMTVDRRGDAGGLRMAKATRDRGNRRLSHPRNAPGLPARPPARPTPDHRRLAGNPLHVGSGRERTGHVSSVTRATLSGADIGPKRLLRGRVAISYANRNSAGGGLRRYR